MKSIMKNQFTVRSFEAFKPWKIISSASQEGEGAPLTGDYQKWLDQTHHAHQHREMLVILAGNFSYRITGKTFHLETGDVVLFDSWEQHTHGYFRGTDSINLWFFFLPGAVNVVIDQNGTVVMRKMMYLGELNEIFFEVWNEFTQSSNTSSLLGREILDIVSVFLAELFRKNIPALPQSLETHSHQELSMKEVVEYINNLSSPVCSVSTLASISGYSKVHFQRLFREYTGCTVREYMKKRRLKLYQYRIAENIPKKEIAYELGFSSTSALIHWEKEKL